MKSQHTHIQDIVKSIGTMDKDTLAQTLAYIIKIYVIDKEIQYEGTVDDKSVNPFNRQSSSSPAAYQNFLDLLSDMKKNCSYIPELNLFSIEGNKAYITLNGQKHSIPISSSAARPAPTGKNPDSTIKSPLIKQDGTTQSPKRFKNLEMD